MRPDLQENEDEQPIIGTSRRQVKRSSPGEFRSRPAAMACAIMPARSMKRTVSLPDSTR
jgi:hypothetical protein